MHDQTAEEIRHVQASDVSEYEKTMVTSYLHLRAALDGQERVMESHFRPLVEALVSRQDFEGARRLLARIPDTVFKVFLMDLIRTRSKQHGG